jgi:hypothetical protein
MSADAGAANVGENNDDDRCCQLPSGRFRFLLHCLVVIIIDRRREEEEEEEEASNDEMTTT